MEVITDANTSIVELTREELQEKYVTLTKVYKKSLEEKNQKIYDLQREFTRISSLEQEYLQEIEILQSNDNGRVKKLEARIGELQKKLLDVKVEHREAVLELEQAVAKKDDENRELRERLASSGKCEDNAERDGAQHERLLEENGILKEEIECLLEKLRENEVNGSELSERFEKATQQNKEECNNLQEIINAKKEELSEVRVLLETLQEENILMRNEMEMMKNQPLDTDARGNSLFAEVNDRRVQLQRNMDKMKSHYLEMKTQNGTLLKQVAALKMENSCLTQQWKEDAIQREVDDDALIQSLKSRVETLEELHGHYENSLKPMEVNADTDELKCMEMMLKSKDKLLDEAWKKQNEQTKKLVSVSRELFISNKELREWKSQAYHLKSKLAELETGEKVDAKKQEAPVVVCKCREERNGRQMNFMRDKRNQKQQPEANTPKYVELDIRKFLFGGDKKQDAKEEEKENNCNSVNRVIEPNKPSSKTEAELSEVVQDECKEKDTNTKKSVKFAEDTMDINKENSKKATKRSNLISCPVVFIPSTPEKS